MSDTTTRGFTDVFDFQTWEDVEEQGHQTQWIWPQWFPTGYLTLLAAMQGVGKSWFALAIARLVIYGGQWPDGHVSDSQDGYILWIETESGEHFHIQRAKRMGLPLSRVITITTYDEDETDVSLTNEATRKRILALAKEPLVKVIVIDSLSGGHELDENSSKTGHITKWLASVAKQSNKPILLVHHMNKQGMQQSEKPPMLKDIRGSNAITQHARVVWTLDTPDFDREYALRLAMCKNNLTIRARPLNVMLEDGRIEWAGRIETANPFDQEVRDYAMVYPNASAADIARIKNSTEPDIARILRTKSNDNIF